MPSFPCSPFLSIIMVHYKLYYMPFRGVAEILRQILAVAGVPYEDERIPKEEFPNRKHGEEAISLISYRISLRTGARTRD